MSWLRTISNSLRLEDDDEANAGGAESPLHPDDQGQHPQSSPFSSSSSPSTPTARGVKEDLYEITQALTTKLWGIASPSDPSSPRQISDSYPDQPEREASEEAVIAGIRSDFSEITGRVKVGVSEISKIASNFFQIGSEEGSLDKYESVGVTEEVLMFVNDIAMHPQTWLDFPVPDEDDEFGEFDTSDAQQEHALAVEHLVPRLAALRMELCPGYMSDGCFWKIYFVLLHPRLDKHIALLLSTSQIMEARALLTPDLRNRSKSGLKGSTRTLSIPEEAASCALEEHLSEVADSEIEKHAVQTREIQVIDKCIIEEKAMEETKIEHSASEDENDEWLKEDISETVGEDRATVGVVSNEDEDVSFSDLEVHDDGDKKDGSDSSAQDSRDWVQLGRCSADSAKDVKSADTEGTERVSSNTENKESNDWLRCT